VGTESKFKTFRRLYVRNKFQTGLAVDIGAAKLSRVIWGVGGGGAVSYLIVLSSPSVIEVVVSIATTDAVFIVLWIPKYKPGFFCCSSTNLELSTCYDFHRIPQMGNNVMVACSLRCKTTDVLFTMAYRFVVPFVCTSMLVRSSEI
jgi:hypothetical protein